MSGSADARDGNRYIESTWSQSIVWSCLAKKLRFLITFKLIFSVSFNRRFSELSLIRKKVNKKKLQKMIVKRKQPIAVRDVTQQSSGIRVETQSYC